MAVVNNGEGSITFEIGTTKEFKWSLLFSEKCEEGRKEQEGGGQNFSNSPREESTDNSFVMEHVTIREEKAENKYPNKRGVGS